MTAPVRVSVDELAAERDTLMATLTEIAAQQPKTLEMIRRNGFVFDDIGAEPGNWQHLAFSIYNDLCQVDAIARAVLAVVAGAEKETP